MNNSSTNVSRDWIISQRTFPWKRRIIPLSSHSLPAVLHLGVRPCEISPTVLAAKMVFSLFRFVSAPTVFGVLGYYFPTTSGRHYLMAAAFMLWLLSSFHRLLWYSPGLRYRGCGCSIWGWLPHNQLFAAFWLIVDFWNRLLVFWHVVSLIWVLVTEEGWVASESQGSSCFCLSSAG